MSRVAVAMSGGVDSSVVAALLVEKFGKDNVFGLTMRLFCYGENEGSEKSCCSLDAVTDAKKVCDQLGISHYVISFEKEFEREVIDNFVSEYEAGHTPNPCIRCNQIIKFEHLLQKAIDLGADFLATGHYAKVENIAGNYKLLKGDDQSKDQSYFLYTLGQKQLACILFPIGNLKKTETRKIAVKLNLKTAAKTESQDICFIPDGVEKYLEGKVEGNPGNIVDSRGNTLGKHKGVAFYTIGQRKGLGGGFKTPMYVTGIDTKENEVIVGPEAELGGDALRFTGAKWTAKEPKYPYKCEAKIRYNMDEQECLVDGDKVIFNELQRAITPGQAIVFYKENEVIGGGTII